MSRRLRRERVMRMAGHVQTLPPEQRGLVILVLLANAIVTIIMNAVLGVAVFRAGRRSWRHRQLGHFRALRAGWSTMLGLVVGVTAAYVVASLWTARIFDERLPSNPVEDHDSGE
jgi:ABC-type Co2+ transport system permease subunit